MYSAGVSRGPGQSESRGRHRYNPPSRESRALISDTRGRMNSLAASRQIRVEWGEMGIREEYRQARFVYYAN